MKLEYIPIQPGVNKANSAGLVLNEYPPDKRLRGHIFCYWTLNSREKILKPENFHGVPDGCVDVFINPDRFRCAKMIGIASSPLFIPVYGNPDYFGVRFLPGKINSFFQISATGIFDKTISFDELAGNDFRETEDRLLNADSFQERVNIIEPYLLKKMDNINKADSRISKLLELSYLSRGSISVAELSFKTGISARHVQRLFESHIGIRPKSFLKIIRFQNTLRAILSENTTPSIEMALDCGYFDQSHFIKDTKFFYGKPLSSIKK